MAGKTLEASLEVKDLASARIKAVREEVNALNRDVKENTGAGGRGAAAAGIAEDSQRVSDVLKRTLNEVREAKSLVKFFAVAGMAKEFGDALGEGFNLAGAVWDGNIAKMGKSVEGLKEKLASLPHGIGEAFQVGNFVGEGLFGDKAAGQATGRITTMIDMITAAQKEGVRRMKEAALAQDDVDRQFQQGLEKAAAGRDEDVKHRLKVNHNLADTLDAGEDRMKANILAIQEAAQARRAEASKLVEEQAAASKNASWWASVTNDPMLIEKANAAKAALDEARAARDKITAEENRQIEQERASFAKSQEGQKKLANQALEAIEKDRAAAAKAVQEKADAESIESATRAEAARLKNAGQNVEAELTLLRAGYAKRIADAEKASRDYQAAHGDDAAAEAARLERFKQDQAALQAADEAKLQGDAERSRRELTQRAQDDARDLKAQGYVRALREQKQYLEADLQEIRNAEAKKIAEAERAAEAERRKDATDPEIEKRLALRREAAAQDRAAAEALARQTHADKAKADTATAQQTLDAQRIADLHEQGRLGDSAAEKEAQRLEIAREMVARREQLRKIMEGEASADVKARAAQQFAGLDDVERRKLRAVGAMEDQRFELNTNKYLVFGRDGSRDEAKEATKSTAEGMAKAVGFLEQMAKALTGGANPLALFNGL